MRFNALHISIFSALFVWCCCVICSSPPTRSLHFAVNAVANAKIRQIVPSTICAADRRARRICTSASAATCTIRLKIIASAA